jgi:hypothetical protein
VGLGLVVGLMKQSLHLRRIGVRSDSAIKEERDNDKIKITNEAKTGAKKKSKKKMAAKTTIRTRIFKASLAVAWIKAIGSSAMDTAASRTEMIVVAILTETEACKSTR